MKPTQTGIAVALALIVITMFFIFPGLSPFGDVSQPQETTDITQVESTTMSTESTEQLQIVDTVIGTGDVAAAGDTVTVHYVGTFTNGTVFDASKSHPETVQGFSFPLGAGRVIQGWDQGVAGMKVGGKRHLVIPASLGYGPNDYGPIPGNSTLIFDVELLKVQKAGQ